MAKKAVKRNLGNKPASATSVVHESHDPAGRSLINEMIAGGATKTAIARAVGVSDMTIMSVAKGTTQTFRKLPQLQKVYDKWKDGKLDLTGQRGKKKADVTAPVIAATEPPKKHRRKAKAEVKSIGSKKMGRPKKKAVPVADAFRLPEITANMIADVEKEIEKLSAQLKYMKGIVAIREKYGM